MTRLRLLTLVFAIPSFLATLAEDVGPVPQAKTLLQGVESSRLEIPPSRLRIMTQYRTANYIFEANLDGAKRRFWIDSNARRKRMILTGSTVTHFDGADSVTFRDVNEQNGSLFFDPRLLGITTTYGWNETLEKELPYRDGTDLRTIGIEEIDGDRCWHVSVVDLYKQRRDYWIDDKNGFRVYRTDFSIPGLKRDSTISYYPDDDPKSWPSLVVTNYYDANDNSKRDPRVFHVLETESNVKYPSDTWGLESLDLPIGAEVGDVRSKRRLGYWNGSGISLNRPSVAKQPD